MRTIPIEKLEFIALILKTISHPIRLQIVSVLEINEKLCVNDISKLLNNKIEQSLLSHHLIKMKDKGVLNSKKEGLNVFYSLKIREIINLLDCMENCKIN